MAEDEEKKLVGTAEIADYFGMTERRVQQLVRDETIHAAKSRPYKFDLRETVREYVGYLGDKANRKRATVEDNLQAEADKLRADADLKQSKAKIAEMQLKELQGQMHRSEDVEAMTTDLVFTVRSMVLALPGRLAMDMAQTVTPAEASARIRAECDRILNELAGYRYDPEKYRRRVREREGWGDLLEDEEDG